MKLPLLFILGFLVYLPAWASDSDQYSSENSQHNGDGMNFQMLYNCIQKSWTATSPTETQVNNALPFLQNVETVFQQNEVNLEQSTQALITAWSAYPISQTSVETAEMNLHQYVVQDYQATRDAAIGILNLLSADQRKTFDSTFSACLQ